MASDKIADSKDQTPCTQSENALDVGQAPCLGLAGKRTTFGFSASARVDPNCVVSASDLNFGVLTDFSRPVDAQTSISVSCSAGLSYTIALDGGRSQASDPTQRKMTSGVASIRYALHRDAARGLPWGASSANAHASVGSGGAQTIPVYGRIAAGQSPSPGSYSDVIVITVAY